MLNKKIPIIFCVDVEPEDRLTDKKNPLPWHGYEATALYLTQIRTRIEKITSFPVHYTWFYRMDPQIEDTYGHIAWPIIHYPDLAEGFVNMGDELGLHIHAYRWDDPLQTWIVDHGNQPWIHHCLSRGFQGFKSALNFPCKTFRFGDRFMNNETMTELQRLGIRYDLTAEPGMPSVPALSLHERHTGMLPDYRGMAHAPYQPASHDWRIPNMKESPGGLIEIPMSSGWGIPAQPSPTWTAKTQRVLKQLIGRPWKPWQPFETVNLARPTASISPIIDHLLETLENPYIACVIRSSTLYYPEKRMAFEANLTHMLHHPRAQDFVFVTPREALEFFPQTQKTANPEENKQCIA